MLARKTVLLEAILSTVLVANTVIHTNVASVKVTATMIASAREVFAVFNEMGLRKSLDAVGVQPQGVD
jgi:hypothetical protein